MKTLYLKLIYNFLITLMLIVNGIAACYFLWNDNVLLAIATFATYLAYSLMRLERELKILVQTFD